MTQNPRHITTEDLELMALRWARSQPGRLSNINVDCFIAGFKAALDMIAFQFGEFLIDEGNYYVNEYASKRINACGYSGIPLTPAHSEEFESADEFGHLPIEAGKLYMDKKLLI